MSTNKNTAVIRKYINTWNTGNLDALFEFWSPNIVHHTRFDSHDFDKTKEIVTSFVSHFEDMRFEINDIIAEDDKVVTRMTWRATQKDPYLGSGASGREISCTVLGIASLADGKIVEHWGVTDELHMMQQMGLVPEELLTAMA